MKTLLWGPVTKEHLADALLFEGIDPTMFVTDGSVVLPTDLATEVIVPTEMLAPEQARKQNQLTLVVHSDAMIGVGNCEKMIALASSYGLLTYHVA